MTASGTNSKLTWSNSKCVQLTTGEVLQHWAAVKPFLDRWVASCHGELTTESIFNSALAGLMHVFIFTAEGDIKLVAVTEFVQYAKKKALRLVAVVGENARVTLKFMPAIEQWAVANGADCLEAWAAPHAEKYVEKLGLTPVYKLMRKSL